MVVVHVCIAVCVVIMACQLTLADVFLGGGVRGRSICLSQCMPICTYPMGGTEVQQQLSLSLYAHLYTPGERVAGWWLRRVRDGREANVSHGHGGAPEAACVCRPCLAWTAWCACVAVVRLPTRRHVHAQPGDGLMWRRRFS